MSYLKLFKSCSDFAVGIQTAQQALDNNEALLAQFDANHSTGVSGAAFGDPFLGAGRHDDPLIARSVADFYIDATLATPAAFALISGPMIFETPIWLQTGQWKIHITTPQLFSAIATIKGATTGSPRQATCFIAMATNGPYVTVSTWDTNAGTLADYDFSLVLWAEGVA